MQDGLVRLAKCLSGGRYGRGDNEEEEKNNYLYGASDIFVVKNQNKTGFKVTDPEFDTCLAPAPGT